MLSPLVYHSLKLYTTEILKVLFSDTFTLFDSMFPCLLNVNDILP